MASPNLSTDCTAKPQFPIVDEAEYLSESIIFEDGNSVSWQDATAKRRSWRLSYANQTESERASFATFFDARSGEYATFYWNHPLTGEVDIKVRFKASRVSYSYDGPVARSWSCEIVEVL